MKYKYYKKQIAPRLLSGDSRESYTGGFPPEVKEGLYAIARKEKKSVSWVIENVVIDYFDLRRPRYKARKLTQEKQEKEEGKITEMSLGKTAQSKAWAKKKGIPTLEVKMGKNVVKHSDYIKKWVVK